MIRRTAAGLVLAAIAASPAQAEWQIILPDSPASQAPAPAAAGTPRPALQKPPAVAGECQASVQAGDSLAILAQRHLGDGKRWREIQRLNGITNPNLIGAGWRLAMPCDGFRRQASADSGAGGAGRVADVDDDAAMVAQLRQDGRPRPAARAETEQAAERAARVVDGLEEGERDAEIAEQVADAEPASAMAAIEDGPIEPAGNVVSEPDKQPGAAVVRDEQQQEAPGAAAAPPARACSAVIQRGDSLAILAQRHLGDGKRWPELAALNNIAEPDLIAAGQVIELPCASGGEMPSEMVMSAEAPRGMALPSTPAAPPAPGPQADELTRQAIASAVRPDGKLPGGDDEGRWDIWEARAGERLDDVISRWAISAGWTPIVTERWSWAFDTDVEVRGTFIGAVRQLLQGFSSAGEAPGVAVYANQVLVLEYR